MSSDIGLTPITVLGVLKALPPRSRLEEAREISPGRWLRRDCPAPMVAVLATGSPVCFCFGRETYGSRPGQSLLLPAPPSVSTAMGEERVKRKGEGGRERLPSPNGPRPGHFLSSILFLWKNLEKTEICLLLVDKEMVNGRGIGKRERLRSLLWPELASSRPVCLNFLSTIVL